MQISLILLWHLKSKWFRKGSIKTVHHSENLNFECFFVGWHISPQLPRSSKFNWNHANRKITIQKVRWKHHFITKLVKLALTLIVKLWIAIQWIAPKPIPKPSNIWQRRKANEKCCEWNLHRNLIKCYCLA